MQVGHLVRCTVLLRLLVDVSLWRCRTQVRWLLMILAVKKAAMWMSECMAAYFGSSLKPKLQ